MAHQDPPTEIKEVTEDTLALQELSIQKRTEEKDRTGSVISMMRFGRHCEDEISPWWSERRDRDLREFLIRPGNDILQGAQSSMIKKFKAMNWVLEGPETPEGAEPLPGSVEYYQPILAAAEFGQGWSLLLGKVLADYLSQDKGGFIELLGRGDPEGPIEPPGVLGLAHLDAGRCQLTGDATFPVLYRTPKDGKQHKLHATRVIHMADMPSPREEMNGTGFCSVSRVIASSQVLLKLVQYKNEKLDDLPQAGLLLLNNILPQKFDDATAEYQHGRRRLGHELWANLMTLFGLDPERPVTADFLNFSGLPDNFDEATTTEIYVNIVALAYGVDVREFWPLSTGSLGTATESLIQHQKARGKGVGDIISTIERAINWKVLPSTVSFQFDFQDDEEDQKQADIAETRTDTIMSMWQPPSAQEMEQGALPPVTRLEIRQMLADNVDYFKDEFLVVDVTAETEVTDTDQAWYRGPRVLMDSKGIIKPVERVLAPAAKKHVDKALELAEANWRSGKVSAEDVAEYALGLLMDGTDG